MARNIGLPADLAEQVDEARRTLTDTPLSALRTIGEVEHCNSVLAIAAFEERMARVEKAAGVRIRKIKAAS